MTISPTIKIYSHADTDLLLFAAACKKAPELRQRASCHSLQTIHNSGGFDQSSITEIEPETVFCFRVLGNPAEIAGWDDFYAKLRKAGASVVVLSGDGERNPTYEALSTVSQEILANSAAYCKFGGVDNFYNLLLYLNVRICGADLKFASPQNVTESGIYHPSAGLVSVEEWWRNHRPDHPVAILSFYRAHWLSQNIEFIDELIGALYQQGVDCIAVFSASGRDFPFHIFEGDNRIPVDAWISTTAFSHSAGDDTFIQRLQSLDVPIVQAICSSMTHEDYKNSSRGLSALDTAMNVAIPEFDGRIISVPISFKQPAYGDLVTQSLYQPDSERCTRVAEIVGKLISLRKKPNSQKRVAFVFTNSSSKASQVGNAVGLDAPASLIAILRDMQRSGYEIGTLPEDSDALMRELIDRCSYDSTFLSESQCAQALALISAQKYSQWFDQIPQELRQRMIEQWGQAPGEAYLYKNGLVIAGLEFGNTVVLLQPPRGYGMDPMQSTINPIFRRHIITSPSMHGSRRIGKLMPSCMSASTEL